MKGILGVGGGEVCTQPKLTSSKRGSRRSGGLTAELRDLPRGRWRSAVGARAADGEDKARGDGERAESGVPGGGAPELWIHSPRRSRGRESRRGRAGAASTDPAGGWSHSAAAARALT